MIDIQRDSIESFIDVIAILKTEYIITKAELIDKLNGLINKNASHSRLLLQLLLLPKLYGFPSLDNLLREDLDPKYFDKDMVIPFAIGLYFARSIYYIKPIRQFAQFIAEKRESYTEIDYELMEEYMDYLKNLYPLSIAAKANTFESKANFQYKLEELQNIYKCNHPSISIIAYIITNIGVEFGPDTGDLQNLNCEEDLDNLLERMEICSIIMKKGIPSAGRECKKMFYLTKPLGESDSIGLSILVDKILEIFGTTLLGFIETVIEVENLIHKYGIEQIISILNTHLN